MACNEDRNLKGGGVRWVGRAKGYMDSICLVINFFAEPLTRFIARGALDGPLRNSVMNCITHK